MASDREHKRSGKRLVGRARFLALCFILVGLLCVSRLYYLQILHGDDYAAKADREFTTPSNPLFERGSIFFTAKDGVPIAAAINVRGVTLAVNPAMITNAESLFQALNSVVPLQHDDFINKLSRPGARYVEIADQLSTTTGAAIQQMVADKKLTGAVITQSAWRSYPAGSLAAQTIGFVGYGGDTLNGRYGLERQYQDILSRTSTDLYSNFFVQLFASVQQTASGKREGDVITTIEPAVQTELDRVLAAYNKQWHPEVVGGIIMDPQTGAIYAISQSPTFDLNNFSSEKDSAVFTNALAQHVYEMGSIFKPLTMAAGIDTGAVTESTTYKDAGCITVNTAKICNFDLRARGVIPMQQVLTQSLNVGASFVATQLGPDRFRDYFLNHYKIGEKTGIDLPSEASGLVSNLQSPRQLEYDEAAFGQGVAVTPIETVRALSTLANGGRLITPHLASAIRTTTGVVEPIDWGDGTQVLQASTTQLLSRMLTEVVDTNKKVNIDHYSVAAKTGTAQIPDPHGGGYIPNTYLHSFFGYLPAYDAKFTIFLFAYKPVGAMYSAETWASYFNDLTHFLINYYAVPPDR